MEYYKKKTPRVIQMTDERGFEPLIPFKVCRISRPVLSTTQTLIQKNTNRNNKKN